MALFQYGLINPAQQLGRFDEFLNVVGAFWHHAQNVFRANHRHQPGFAVAVERGEEDLAAGFHQLGAGFHYRLRVRHVFQHLHAGHHVILPGVLRRVFFYRFLNVIDGNTGF